MLNWLCCERQARLHVLMFHLSDIHIQLKKEFRFHYLRTERERERKSSKNGFTNEIIMSKYKCRCVARCAGWQPPSHPHQSESYYTVIRNHFKNFFKLHYAPEQNDSCTLLMNKFRIDAIERPFFIALSMKRTSLPSHQNNIKNIWHSRLLKIITFLFLELCSFGASFLRTNKCKLKLSMKPWMRERERMGQREQRLRRFFGRRQERVGDGERVVYFVLVTHGKCSCNMLAVHW